MNAPSLAQCLAPSSRSKRKRLHREPGERRAQRGPHLGKSRHNRQTDECGRRPDPAPLGVLPFPLPSQPPRAPHLSVHVGQAVPAELVEEPLALEVVHDHGHELRVPGAGPRAARRTRARASPGARRRRWRLRLRRGRRRRRRRRLRLRVGGHGGLGRGRRGPGRAGAPGRRRLHRSRRLKEANGMLLRNQRIQSNPGSEKEPGEERNRR